MNKSLFLAIVDRLSQEFEFFQLKEDASGRSTLSPLQKCTAAIRQLAYGGALMPLTNMFGWLKPQLENVCTISLRG